MAKAVVRKQALRVAGKTVNKEVANQEEATDQVATPKLDVTPKAPSQKATAKAKAEAKTADQAKIIADSGYAIGDSIMMKSGRIVEVTKITTRPQGVHLWWKTENGPSAGGHYTFGVRGKMVKNVCVDPISGDAIALPEPKAKVEKKATK